MKKIKIIFSIFFILIFINACSSVKEGLTKSKKKSGDEFLVEKKAPLVLPPNFNELPEPSTNDGVNQKNDFDLEKIINQNTSKTENQNDDNKDSSIEDILLKKIRKK